MTTQEFYEGVGILLLVLISLSTLILFALWGILTELRKVVSRNKEKS